MKRKKGSQPQKGVILFLNNAKHNKCKTEYESGGANLLHGGDGMCEVECKFLIIFVYTLLSCSEKVVFLNVCLFRSSASNSEEVIRLNMPMPLDLDSHVLFVLVQPSAHKGWGKLPA